MCHPFLVDYICFRLPESVLSLLFKCVGKQVAYPTAICLLRWDSNPTLRFIPTQS
ncbi:MAG: hypothetical protein IJV56_09185 [Neisseriaceae bacterium]|nr:hypothetical protein [Neisseriaceae bacterium]